MQAEGKDKDSSPNFSQIQSWLNTLLSNCWLLFCAPVPWALSGKWFDDDGGSAKQSGGQHDWGSGTVEAAAATEWANASWKNPNPSAAQKEKELQFRVS